MGSECRFRILEKSTARRAGARTLVLPARRRHWTTAKHPEGGRRGRRSSLGVVGRRPHREGGGSETTTGRPISSVAAELARCGRMGGAVSSVAVTKRSRRPPCSSSCCARRALCCGGCCCCCACAGQLPPQPPREGPSSPSPVRRPWLWSSVPAASAACASSFSAPAP